MHIRLATVSRSLFVCIVLIISVKLTSTSNIYVWPLGDEIFNREIKSDASQGTIGDISVASGFPALNYPALAFNGLATSYIDLYVPAFSSLTEDSALLFYLYLEDNTEGVLFHFQGYDPSAENVLTGIHISFSGATVKFDFVCQSSTWSGGNHSVTAVLNTGAWNVIALSRDYSKGKTKFYINDLYWNLNGGPAHIPLQLPGVIRIGYSQLSSVGLHGRISCFIIQDTKFKYHKLADAQAACETSNWGTAPVSCSPNCHSGSGFFELTDSGKTLVSFIPRLESASNYTSSRCGASCLANSKCISFMIWKSTGHCELYGGNYRQYMLENDSGDPDYYVRTDAWKNEE